MKIVSIVVAVILLHFHSLGQDSTTTKMVINKAQKTYTVNAACGTCIFKMKGNNCELAIQFNNNYYFVQGTSIDDHGDAHATDGFCNAAKKATVQGKVKNGKFVATYFKLIEPKKQ